MTRLADDRPDRLDAIVEESIRRDLEEDGWQATGTRAESWVLRQLREAQKQYADLPPSVKRALQPSLRRKQ